jgi:type III pantothenate kinase
MAPNPPPSGTPARPSPPATPAVETVLVVDIGNSGAKIGAVRGEDVAGPVRLPVADAKSVRAFAEPLLKGQKALIAVAGSNPDKAKDLAWELARLKLGEAVAVDAKHPGVPWPKLTQPERAGMDRRLQALAAAHLAQGPAAVVSCGTAITVDLADEEGALVGGAILPGLMLGMKALAAGTALLPEVALEGLVKMPALDTETALRTGIVLGAAGAVDRLLAEAGVAGSLPLYLTGQDAKVLAPHLGRTHRLHPGLGLLGIALAVRKRR